MRRPKKQLDKTTLAALQKLQAELSKDIAKFKIEPDYLGPVNKLVDEFVLKKAKLTAIDTLLQDDIDTHLLGGSDD